MASSSNNPLTGGKKKEYGSIEGTVPATAAANAGEEEVYRPYDNASLWSSLTFGWLSPLLALGNEKEQMQPEDLNDFPLPKSCGTLEASDNFEQCWLDEKKKAATKLEQYERELLDDDEGESAPAPAIANGKADKDKKKDEKDAKSMGGDNKKSKKKKKKKKKKRRVPEPSLFWALGCAFRGEFLRAGLLKLCHDMLQFVGPQVLNGLIRFLSDKDAPMSTGFGLTAAVTLAQLLMSFCLRHYFFRCYGVGLRVRTSIVMAVYRKALVLAAAERQTRTTGEITNLVSIDAQRLQDLTTYLHAVWYSPLQIIIALFFLWQQLGPSCLGGVAVIIIMMPVTKSVAQFMGGMQRKVMNARDRRVDINNEVLGSMKVIKFQAWESSFQDKIEALRKAELNQLFRYFVGAACTIMLWSAVPLLVALASFAAYVLMGNFLDVATALTSLALFEILRFPLFMLPQVINNIVEAMVSLNRVQSFLMCKEHDPVGEGNLVEDGSVKVKDASFVYDSKRPKLDVAQGVDPHVAQKLSDSKWEVMLLRSQLADAERQIRQMVDRKEEEESPGMIIDAAERNDSPTDNLLSLRRVDFETKHELIAVVGAVGAGKSTLINSLLGEVRPVSGSVAVKGKIAYFGQTPFILNETVRGNIQFGGHGTDLDDKKYKKAVSVCALKHDLTILPNGDLCEIGEKGITLSGGQKARVAMARAVYHDADIYLLDDPLAAVDAHVGRHLFQRCIVDTMLYGKKHGRSDRASNGIADGRDGEQETKRKKSTVILVTNALQYLSSPCVDRILVLEDGVVKERGTYAELTGNSNSLFSTFLRSFQDSLGKEDDGDDDRLLSVPSTSNTSLNELTDAPDAPEVANVLSPKRKPSISLKNVRAPSTEAELTRQKSDAEKKTTIVQGQTDEFKEREVGHVGLDVYLSWAQAAGGAYLGVFVVLGYAGVEGISVISRWWLTYWSTHATPDNQMYFLGMYAVINFTYIFATFCRLLLVTVCSIRASRKLFSRLLDAIMMAQMSFFDTTPIGRIVNRFSKDMYTVDEQLVSTLRSYLATLCGVLWIVVVISGVHPWFIVALLPMFAFYAQQQHFFTKSYRELKRLDSVSRSPLYALLGETLDGIATLRAFESEDFLLARIVAILNRQQTAYFLTFTAQCFLAVRLEVIGTCIITFAALFGVLEHPNKGGDPVFASLAGLAVSFSLQVTQSLNWSVRMGSDLEANMIAVERVEQYCKVRSEAPRERDFDKGVPKGWPERGEIEFSGAKLRYRPGLPLVLKGLSLRIPSRSKVGVVGRTGAGKSTLMVALLRIVELDAGTIRIDDVNIGRLGLALLRSKIAVIPQDPVLFTGSVRTNLDPFNDYEDGRLYEVLVRVGLCSSRGTSEQGTSSASASRKGVAPISSLEQDVFEGGSNFSVGQRQLIVIARALLQESMIVIMDEATAAVDAETDARIQKVMRTEFKDATCITVAHRLNTIMDSDYILVMDDGRVSEFDSPSALLSIGGTFKDLVDTWEEEHGE